MKSDELFEKQFDESWYEQAQGLYNITGFMLIRFSVDTINDIITRSRAGCGWRVKYPGTLDMVHDGRSRGLLRELVHCVCENDVPHILDTVTSTTLTLVHCQVRKVERGDASYMSWHRDTYVDHLGNWIGNVPPVHKLIVYPIDDDHVQRPQLELFSRTHRMSTDDMQRDLVIVSDPRSGFERVQIMSSNDSALLFNTAALHAALPTQSSHGSWRIIYSFATQQQLQRRYSNDDIHRHVSELYEELK